MNALVQKLYDSKNDEEFAQASSAIYKAIEAAPAEMEKELTAAYEKAQEEENAAREFYEFALSDLNKADTIENKAAAWDAYWARSNASGIAHELYEHMNDAGFQAAYPEEVKRMKDAKTAAALASVDGEVDPF